MTNLVADLYAFGQKHSGLIGRLMLQAAQEIERLHGDLKAEKALVDRLTNTGPRNPPVPLVCKTVAGPAENHPALKFWDSSKYEP